MPAGELSINGSNVKVLRAVAEEKFVQEGCKKLGIHECNFAL